MSRAILSLGDDGLRLEYAAEPDARFTIEGMRTVSEANAHEHWRKRQKRAKAQRAAAYCFAQAAGVQRLKPPCTIRLTRIAPRLLDSDNAVGALKHVRDGIADALGIDDRDPRITWEYAQAKMPKRYAVHVEVRQ